MQKQIEFYYGALSDPIEKQANNQGFTLGKNKELIEKLSFAINILFVHGYIPPSNKKKMLDKLHKKVLSSLEKADD